MLDKGGYPCAVEFDDGIVVELLGGFVNPEWASSHAYRSAKTYGCIGPNVVDH